MLSILSLVLASTFMYTLTVEAQTPDFRFSTIYGDHMVLQQAPNQANVWGYTSSGDSVSVNFDSKDYPATIITDASGKSKWRVTLPQTKADAQATYTITATSQKHGSIKISDVLFGDVWVCSGQSNMQFTVPQVYNASVEIENAAKYPLIRLFTAALKDSPTPLDELMQVEQPWSIADSKSISGGAWSYFSATCWFFGRNLFDSLKYPIGLVDTDWGGTPVEAWSSSDALAKCGVRDKQPLNHTGSVNLPEGPGSHSVLWNAMIYPFLNMTIKGAVWYQGEANAGSNNYNCTFPTMIDDWREKWHTFSMGQTDPLFGFGFVQLAADGSDNKTVGGFPTVRWAQTANYGYVPNDRLQNVFMAVAMDLGDPKSPFGSVHPRDKQDVGARLARSGRAVVYKDESVYFQGPLAQSATLSKSSGPVGATVTFKLQSEDQLDLRYKYGFEVGCGNSTGGASQWIEGTAMNANGQSVQVEFSDCPSPLTPVSIRYCWRTDPCTFMMCPIYAGDLPSPPFMMDFQK